MTKEQLLKILRISEEKQIPEKEACLEVLGKYINLSSYKHKFGIEVNPVGKSKFTARVERKFEVNDAYFSTINNENSYYAGFIAADGNIDTKNSKLTIGLSSKDKTFLETFLSNLDSTYTVKDSISKEQYECSTIYITSKQICEDLYSNFNIYPNKSLTLTPPNLENEFLDCFIMGLIDGDGTIGYSARKEGTQPSFYISVVGTKEMMELVKNRFEFILKKETSKLFQRDSSKNFYQYRISDRQARIVFLYFYEKYNYLPTLSRKWSKEHYVYCKFWKKQSAPSRQKGVNIFDLQGNLIKTCKTLKEAEEFTGTASSTISKLCKENTNMHQSNGYMFGRDIEIMKPYREV